MKAINKIGLFVFLTSFGVSLMGQEAITDTTNKTTRTNLNESVIISAQFDPIVNEAMKLSENPNIFDTTFKVPDFKYEIINKVYPTQIRIEEIKPARVKGEPVSMLYNGNIKAGIGTYLTPYFEGLYSETRNRTFLYSIHARHYSSHWSIKDYPTSHFANNDINLYAKKIWDKFYVDAKVYYNNSINYYYGFNNDSIKLKDKNFRALWHNVGFKTTYSSLYRNDNSLHHWVSLGVENLSSKWSSNELTFFLMGDANKQFELFNKEKQVLGVKINYKHSFFKYDIKNIYTAPYYLNQLYPLLNFNTEGLVGNPTYNTGIVEIKPYFDFKISRFQLHTALNFSPEFGKKSDFRLLPTAIVYFPIIPKKLYFQGGIEGNVERIALNSFRIENPYVSPFLQIKPTTKINLFAKLNSNINDMGISVEGGIQNIYNHHFYVNDTLSYYKNMFSIVYDDVVRFYAKGHFEYNIAKTLSLMLDMQYQTFKMKRLDFAYYQPAFTTSLSLQYIVAKKLIIDFAPTFKTGVKAIYMGEEKKLDPIVDINLNAQYIYSNQLSFFLKLNNLAFQRYEQYYSYPSQRFMGMIGASFSF